MSAADDARMAYECGLMQQHTAAAVRIIDAELCFEEEINTNFGIPFSFRMHVPARFPAVSPRVYCLAPVVPKTQSFHTYSDGRLCLYSPGEWCPDFTLLDVRNWYCEWAFNVVPRLHGQPGWMSPEHARVPS